MTRREKFRAYMANMSATANPKLAIERQLYVTPPDAISDHIVRRFEIEPASRQLVVGGIGAGKTTQLLRAQAGLSALDDVCAEYIDVSEQLEMAQARPGCLVALAGLYLRSILESKSATSIQWAPLMSWAKGYWRYPYEDYYGDDGDGSEWQPGIVTPPKKPWVDIADDYVSLLHEAHGVLAERGQNLVLLFDSLDRMTDTRVFTKIVEQDVAALHWAKIGVVLIGPIRSLSGFERLDVEHFDYLHLQSPVDVEHDERGRSFLFDVLRRRGTPEILPDETARRLVNLSGGVLRDLIYLAKAAGDEAYRQGAECIGGEHADAAAEGYGRALLVGLKQEEIETLKHLRATGGFVRTSQEDLELIATRRILEYRSRSSPFAFSVHPVIAPLLDQLAGRT